LGIGFVLAVVYLSLTPYPPVPDVPGAFDAGHFFAYFWLMFWFAQIHAGMRDRLLLAAAFFLLGVGLEFVQRMTGYRMFEISDMVFDAIGIVTAFALVQTPLQHALRALERLVAR
jgi:VanZ family protein